jgi:DNA-binding response OmpR family regulator
MCGKKILIAEDEPSLLNSLVFTLKRFHFKTMGISDGLQAIEHLINSENEGYDLFITDIQLPGLSGFEVIDKMRAAGIHTPILVITAYGDQQVLSEISRRKIDGYLAKPFTMNDLLQSVFQQFNRSNLV